MVKLKCILAIIFLLALLGQAALAGEVNHVDLYVFYSQGCQHCSKMNSFLGEVSADYSNLEIHRHEIHNMTSRQLFENLSASYGEEIQGVPTVFVSDKVFVGYSEGMADQILQEVKRCTQSSCINPTEKLSPADKTQHILTIPIIVSAAAVDAINPCAFAVLIILMSAALTITNKKKALVFGLFFTAAIYISYFLIGLGLYSALNVSGLSTYFYKIVIVLAIVVGLLNIKDYFWYGKGFLMEVPLSWRPRMKKILNKVTSPLGAFFAGFAVSLFELPCTGGPYIVILGLIAKEVSRTTGVLYLLLYNMVFVLPLIVLSVVIYKGLSTTQKLEQVRQERIRLLHLIAGVIMLVIAAAMIFTLL